MAQQINRQDYIFEQRTGQKLVKEPGRINGLAFSLYQNQDCEIYLWDLSGQVFVDNQQNCKIFIGPCKSSIFVRDCQNIQVHCVAQQFRVSDCQNVRCFIYSESDPALENSQNIVFAPANFIYPGLKSQFQQSGMNPTTNKWSQVYDFTPNFEKKNWSLLNPADYPGKKEFSVEGFENENELPFNLPTAYGGNDDADIIVGSQDANSKEKSGLFDLPINMGQKEAEVLFQKTIEVAQQGQNQIQDEVNAMGFLNLGQQQSKGSQDSQGNPEENARNFNDFDGFNNVLPSNPVQPVQSFVFGNAPVNNQTSTNTFNLNNDMGTIDSFGNNSGLYNSTFQAVPATNLSGGNSGFGFDTGTNFLETKPSNFQIQQQKANQMIEEKRAKENREKAEIRQKAQEYQKDLLNQQQKQTELNRKSNRDLNQAMKNNKEVYKNPWEKIMQNIALKPGDYQGTMDVTRFREAIINKVQDFEGK